MTGRLLIENIYNDIIAPIEDGIDSVKALQNYWFGLSSYVGEFMGPYFNATSYFSDVEKKRVMSKSPLENIQAHYDLLRFNFAITAKGYSGSLKFLNDYASKEGREIIEALFNTLFNGEGETLQSLIRRHSRTINIVTTDYPKAISEIEPEFGFHFERGDNKIVAETDRFILYKIAPTDKHMVADNRLKPLLIVPPYVLGANILAFLPHENRSYAHCFANQRIPTYIRILKDIRTNEAVQLMNGEDDALDTKYFCKKIKEIHGQQVTLNGYCQGGFSVVCNVLSGELDDLVDSVITCVSPIDGSKCAGLSEFLQSLPTPYNDLAYGTKTLESGNTVADGDLMSWIYKLKSIENESPLVSFYRDLIMHSPSSKEKVVFNKTATALNYWLKNERTDLPLGITGMSFKSFNTPISKDGTLPVTLFGRKLNMKRIKEKNIKWLVCYGEKDDLVEKAAALAPLCYIDVESSPFPKGHVAIATSWSNPKSEFALHKRYHGGKYRGPVRFQLDLNSNVV